VNETLDRPGTYSRGRPKSGVLTELMGDSPWRVADAQRVGVRLAIGLAGIVVAWAGASGTLTWRNQLIWTAVAAGAVLIAAGGAALWLLSGFGAIKVEQRDLKQKLYATLSPESAGEIRTTDPGDFLWAPGMTRFHGANCELIVGKPVQSLTSEDCRRRELYPCGMCQP
jgi:hypothetical protein